MIGAANICNGCGFILFVRTKQEMLLGDGFSGSEPAAGLSVSSSCHLWPSGTYRCDVQDVSFRRVKREYWGVRVLPTGLFNLDYHPNESPLDGRNSTGSQQGVLMDPRSTLLMAVGVDKVLMDRLLPISPAAQLKVRVNVQVLTGLSVAGLGAALVLLRLCRRSQTRALGP